MKKTRQPARPSLSQFQILEAVARKDHFIHQSGYNGSNEVRKLSDPYKTVRKGAFDTVHKMYRGLGWLVADPEFDAAKASFHQRPRLYISDLGRKVLKEEKARRKKEGLDKLEVFAWDSQGSSATHIKNTVGVEGHLLESAFHDVVGLLARGTGGVRVASGQNKTKSLFGRATRESSGARSTQMFDPGDAEALRALHRAIEKALKAAWDGGHRSGSSIALSLAGGDLSINQYNEKADERAKASGGWGKDEFGEDVRPTDWERALEDDDE